MIRLALIVTQTLAAPERTGLDTGGVRGSPAFIGPGIGPAITARIAK